MDRLLLQLLQSKTFQGLGIGVGFVFMIIYVAGSFGMAWIRTPIIAIFCLIILCIMTYKFFLKGMKLKKSVSFEKGLSKDMTDSGKGGSVSARKAQSEVAVRWNNAVGEIKKSGMDIYSLPWYLLIGEPQSGKSTTLRNSGLEFPVGTEALSGAGGTRNCDWWFTNEAVILDTAGRFTFQEKNAPDEGEWKTFLGLLKKRRQRCPINGVLLVIPCSSLLGDSDEVREQKAINIREKLTQLQRDLEIQFPVFVLVTKGDQILGFTEFFARLPAVEQRQILGWSMHGPFIQAYDPAKFEEYFETVSSRLHKLRLKILGEDLGLSEVDKIYVFPDEFKSIREPLRDYFKTIFVRTHYLPALFFRGFYFTSGLQEGKPIARAIAAMLRTAGEGADEIVEDIGKTFTKSKAFFIRDFYIDKLFPERSMVIHSVKQVGLFKRLGLILTIASILLLLATGGFMYMTYKSMERRIGGLGTEVAIIHKDFIDTAKTNRDFQSKGAIPPPPPDGVELAGLGKAQAFAAKIATPEVKSLKLDAQLNEMHWLYFVQNVLYPQGRYLYDEANKATEKKPGASSSAPDVGDPNVAAQYAEYAKLWSMNDGWLRKSRESGTAKLKLDTDVKWDWLFPEGKPGSAIMAVENKQVTLREAFAEQLKLASATLDNQGLVVGEIPLKSDKTPDDTKYGEMDDPPIELWLVPGALGPRENVPIKREIEKAGDVPPMEDAMIDDISAKARKAKEQIDLLRDGALFNNKWCSVNPADDNPFAEATKLAADIDAAISALEKALNDYRPQLDAAGAMGNKDNIRKRFEALAWVNSAFGEPKYQTTKLIDEKVDELARSLGNSGDEKLKKLRDDKDLAYFLSPESLALNSKTIELRKDLGELAKGVRVYQRYAEAQGKFIKDVASNSIPNIAKIDKVAVIDEITKGIWASNAELKEAQAFAAAYPKKPGPPPDTATIPGKIEALAAFIADSIKFGGEAIWVEAYMQHLKTRNIGGGVVTEAHIKNATLKSDPGKSDPWNWEVFDPTNKSLQALIDEIDGYAKGVECPASKRRLEDKRDEAAGIQKSMRGKFEDYWAKAFERWDPVEWIRDKSSWDSFHGDPIFQKTEIVSRSQKDLERFSVHMKGIGGSKNYPKIEKDIESFLDSNSKAVDSAEGFAKAVTDMPASVGEATAKFALERAAIDKRIDPVASALQSKFAPYPNKFRELLGGDPYDGLEKTLAAFLRKWRPELENSFPFLYDRSLKDPLQVGETKVTIKQCKADRLLAFFVGDEGLEALLADPAVKPLFDSWIKLDRNKSIKRFFDQCRAMSAFLIEGKAYKLIEIQGTYTGFAKGGAEVSADNLAKISDDLKFFLPADKEEIVENWRTRPDKNRKAAIKWRPGKYPEDKQFRFKSLYLNFKGNPEDENTAGLRVAGDFGILAYIDKKSGGGSRKEFKGILFEVAPEFKVRKGKPGADKVNPNEVYAITFNFEMPQELPELPNWADTDALLKK